VRHHGYQGLSRQGLQVITDVKTRAIGNGAHTGRARLAMAVVAQAAGITFVHNDNQLGLACVGEIDGVEPAGNDVATQ
jgi:hypothetical protein